MKTNNSINIASIADLDSQTMMSLLAKRIDGNRVPFKDKPGKVEVIAQEQGEEIMIVFRSRSKRFHGFKWDEWVVTTILGGWIYRMKDDERVSAMDEFAVRRIYKSNDMVTVFLSYVG